MGKSTVNVQAKTAVIFRDGCVVLTILGHEKLLSEIDALQAKLDAVNQLKRWTILGATELTKNSQHPPFWVNAHDLAAIGKQGNGNE